MSENQGLRVNSETVEESNAFEINNLGQSIYFDEEHNDFKTAVMNAI